MNILWDIRAAKSVIETACGSLYTSDARTPEPFSGVQCKFPSKLIQLPIYLFLHDPPIVQGIWLVW